MMLACRRLLEERRLPAKNCLLLGAADEEWGTTGIQRFAESGIQVSAAVVGEPTSLQVVSAHNGEIYFKILAHGKAAHTSRPYLGVNAIDMMGGVLQALRTRAASSYPQRVHPLCGPPQLTASIIQGGSAESVVPASCHLSFDRRVSPGETWQEALEEIRGWIAEDLDAETAKNVELVPPHYNMPPFETPVDHPLVLGLRTAVEDTVGHAEVTGVPYGTDAAFLAVKGVPVVVFGPGDIAQAHNVGEYVEIEELVAATLALERFLTVEAKLLP
jgi:acetylornithine deacetylase